MDRRKTMLRRAGTGLMVGLILTALLSTSVAADSAGDLAGNWSEPYVKELIERGILSLEEDGQFHPNEEISVGTFVTWLISASRGSKMEPQSCMAIAGESGILDSELSPGDSITRNSAAQITSLALLNLFGEAEEDSTLAQQLKDFASCHMCRSYTSQCYVKGIMIGREARVFGGEAWLTRGEGAAIVLRTMDPQYRLYPEPDPEAPILLTPDAAVRMLRADDRAVLVDVRDETERTSGGYIPGSISIPLSRLQETGCSDLEEKKEDIIIVYCQGGGRSAQAYELLKSLGFSQVYNMGGISNWPYELITP